MSHHPPAIFIADSRGLDFLNSVATPVDTPVDWISDGEGLLDWLGQANYVAADVLKEIRARAKPGELDQITDYACSAAFNADNLIRQAVAPSQS